MLFASDQSVNSFWDVTVGDIFTGVAIIVSSVSAALTIYTARHVLLAQYLPLDRLIESNPEVLRFHNITEADLAEAQVTVKELAYLSSQFLMGSIYERLGVLPKEGPFAPGSYRYTLCSSEATRRAWPLVKRMLSSNQYIQRVDETIALFPPPIVTAPVAANDKTSSIVTPPTTGR